MQFHSQPAARIPTSIALDRKSDKKIRISSINLSSMQLKYLVEWLSALTISYGYLGVFIASFLGNLLLFIPIPYLMMVFGLSAPSFGFDPTLLALASALGASLAKLITYAIGFESRHLLSEERRRKLEFARWIVARHGMLIVFLFAATPLPDDMLYIPLGIMGYSLIKFFASVLAGKIILTLIVSWGGHYSIEWLMPFFSSGGWMGAIVTVIFIALSIYATLKVDWEKLCLTLFSDKVEGLKYLLDEREKEREK